MHSVIIIAPRDYWPTLTGRLRAVGRVHKTGDATGPRVCVDNGEHHAYLDVYTEAEEELSWDGPALRNRIETFFATPFFYVLEFSFWEAFLLVLEGIANDPEIVVLGDDGLMVRGPDFIQLMKSRKPFQLGPA